MIWKQEQETHADEEYTTGDRDDGCGVARVKGHWYSKVVIGGKVVAEDGPFSTLERATETAEIDFHKRRNANPWLGMSM